MHVGNKIKRLIKQRGIDQKELAERSGYSEGRISGLLNQESCQVSTVEKVCTGFGITLAEFFSDDLPEHDQDKLLSIVKEIGLPYLTAAKMLKDDNISVDEFKAAVNELRTIGYFDKK